MGPVTARTSIDAPREAVFDLLLDLSARRAFTDHFIDELRLERLDPVGVGAAARFRFPARGLWVETAIAEVERPHLIVERGRGGRLARVRIDTVWELVEGPSADSCEVTVTFMTEPIQPFDRISDILLRLRGGEGWYRRRWARALARLREIAESGGPIERVTVAGGDRIPG